jgi:hypothetical protein
MTPIVRSVIRTAVPAVAGAASGYLAKHGFNVNGTTAMAVMPIATSIYKAAALKLEAKYGWAKVLLGVSK